jgi:hypothetical protein
MLDKYKRYTPKLKNIAELRTVLKRNPQKGTETLQVPFDVILPS